MSNVTSAMFADRAMDVEEASRKRRKTLVVMTPGLWAPA